MCTLLIGSVIVCMFIVAIHEETIPQAIGLITIYVEVHGYLHICSHIYSDQWWMNIFRLGRRVTQCAWAHVT